MCSQCPSNDRGEVSDGTAQCLCNWFVYDWWSDLESNQHRSPEKHDHWPTRRPASTLIHLVSSIPESTAPKYPPRRIETATGRLRKTGKIQIRRVHVDVAVITTCLRTMHAFENNQHQELYARDTIADHSKNCNSSRNL